MNANSAVPTITVVQDMLYAGLVLELILFGMELVLYFQTMRIFLGRRKTPRNLDMFYAAINTVMLILITIWVSVDLMVDRGLCRIYKVLPGSSTGKESGVFLCAKDAYRDAGWIAAFILQQMTDSIMLYRCQIIWDSSRAIAIPFVLWFTTLPLGILVLWSTCAPGGSLWRGLTAKLGLAYFSASIALSTTLTSMICYRLLRHAKSAKEHLGDPTASPYFTIIMLFVESVLPYTISGIAFLISYGLESTTGMVFLRVYISMMCLSPQILILRIADGTVWQREPTEPRLPTIAFSPNYGTASDSDRWDDEASGRGSKWDTSLKVLDGKQV